MRRVVLDTNVFISAVLGGVLAPILDHWRAEHFTLVVTEDIAHEYFEVLRRPKFALPVNVVDDIAAFVLNKAEFVVSLERLLVVKADPKDDKFIEAAVAGDAGWIVTGDKHLLSIENYRRIEIITAHEFMRHLKSEFSGQEFPPA